MRKTHHSRQVRILLADILLLYLSLFLALVVRNGELPTVFGLTNHMRHFTLIFLGWIIVFYTAGLYRIDRPFDDALFAQRLAVSVLVAGLGSAVYFYLIPSAPIEPKTVIVIFTGIYAFLFWVWRYSYGRFRRSNLQRIGVGFIGFNSDAGTIVEELAIRPYLGYDARFVLEEERTGNAGGLLVVHDASDLRRIVDETDSDLLVIANETGISDKARAELFNLLDLKVRFIRLPDFYEMILRRVPIGAINEAWFLENIDLKSKHAYETGKRILDLLFAGLASILFLPFWPLVAILVKATSPGPVLFTQIRIGRFGVPFRIFKFRTMRVDRNDSSPTTERDARITPIGRILRATRIDELPQIVNILRGEMSIVGPRPERPDIAEELAEAIPYYRQRHLVKPGITGWDQVSGEYHSPSVEDTYKKLQYDLYYLKNMSLFLDVSISFKTVMTVLQREGR
ncbi:MAG: sugar transferase [Spirochaetales bacterium]|nr:sugar transferase [Spirochaetales bacterium]